MFCPNCGTENEDSATTCKKCGFNLKGAAAPKFKGTMLMVNPPAQGPRPSGPAAPNPVGPPAAAPATRPQLKGTMLGVAPPGLGAPIPVPAPTPAPNPGFGPPPGGIGQHPPGDVNPLGGTLVADPANMRPNPGFGPAPGGPAAPGGFGPPPGGFGPPPGGFGPPPGGSAPGGPSGGGYGPPPGAPQGGFGPPPGAPQGHGGFNPPSPGGFAPPGGPPPGYGQPGPAPQGGYGPPPGAPQGGYGPPPGSPEGGYAPGFTPPGNAPGAMVPARNSAIGPVGPTGKERNAIMVVVLTMVTCGIYGLIQFWGMLHELKAFRQKDDFNPVTSFIFLFIPILGWLEMYKTGERVADAKRMAGIQNPDSTHPVLYIFLSYYFFPADLNEIWRAAGGAAQK